MVEIPSGGLLWLWSVEPLRRSNRSSQRQANDELLHEVRELLPKAGDVQLLRGEPAKAMAVRNSAYDSVTIPSWWHW